MSASVPSSSDLPLHGRHILVTGGAGYIGSHTVLHLISSGARVTIVDNLSNSNLEALARVEKLAGGIKLAFYQVDIRDAVAMEKVFQENKFDACIHFAGLKVRGEARRSKQRKRIIVDFSHSTINSFHV